MLTRRKIWLIAFVGSAAGLLVAWLANASTVLVLALWFVLWVSLFHWFFAQMRNLTMRTVRAIDYLYIGTAAVGVFFLAASNTAQYAEYRTQLRWIEARADTVRARSVLSSRLEGFLKSVCQPPSAPVAEYCERATKIPTLIETGGRAELEQMAGDYLVAAQGFPNRPLLGTTRRIVNGRELASDQEVEELLNPQPSWRGRMLSYALRDYAKALKAEDSYTAVDRTKPRTTMSHYEIWFGLGQVLLWPFILAVAFALRLTKVTIEVFEWTKTTG